MVWRNLYMGDQQSYRAKDIKGSSSYSMTPTLTYKQVSFVFVFVFEMHLLLNRD